MQHNPYLMHATGNLIHPWLTYCPAGPYVSENFITEFANLHFNEHDKKYHSLSTFKASNIVAQYPY